MSKRHPERIQSRVQAANIQRYAYDVTMRLKQAEANNEIDKVVILTKLATALHKLSGAWDTAADRRRILLGKGLPRTTDNSKAKRKTRPRQVPEPIQEPVPVPAAGLEQAAMPAPTPEPKPTL